MNQAMTGIFDTQAHDYEHRVISRTCVQDWASLCILTFDFWLLTFDF
jgi:hypothetical protein